jgi:hypothetical protein
MDRRLDRLTDQIAVGRLIVLNIAHEHVEDCTLIEATLTASGIERTEPAYELLSVSPLPSDAQRHRR